MNRSRLAFPSFGTNYNFNPTFGPVILVVMRLTRMDSSRERLQAALRATNPAATVLTVARELRDEGMSQLELYRIFNEYRAIHENDADEIRYDAILDTMDFIVGWCSPNSRLYDTQLPPDTV